MRWVRGDRIAGAGPAKAGQHRKVALYNRAAPHLFPPGERVEVPGQGETFFRVKLGPDFERYSSAVVDMLAARSEIDSDAIGNDDGDHCCHNRGHLVRPRMADWMARRPGARR